MVGFPLVWQLHGFHVENKRYTKRIEIKSNFFFHLNTTVVTIVWNLVSKKTMKTNTYNELVVIQ